MSDSLSVVMIGATGAVGGHCMRTLLAMPELEKLTLLGRRKMDEVSGDLVEQLCVDLLNPSSYHDALNGRTSAICTLGVGQPSKVSKDEFTRIDKTMVVAFATACRAAGVRHFVLLSAVGVDSQSRSFYLRTKGELVDALRDLEFERLSVFCPSMILTPTNRYGLSQAILLKTWPWVQPLMVGPLKNFRGIQVGQLGAAMANTIPQDRTGFEILYWDDFRSLANRT